VACGRPLLLRQPFPPDAFDEVILGCVNVMADEMNPARVAALRLGMGEEMTAFTVQINCGSGMLSIDVGYQSIREGRSDLVLAGGAEALSHTPLMFRRSAVDWYARLAGARSLWSRITAVLGFRPSFLKPVIGLERGSTPTSTRQKANSGLGGRRRKDGSRARSSLPSVATAGPMTTMTAHAPTARWKSSVSSSRHSNVPGER
jgi:acetyl-CoA C-acetyltransferase